MTLEREARFPSPSRPARVRDSSSAAAAVVTRYSLLGRSFWDASWVRTRRTWMGKPRGICGLMKSFPLRWAAQVWTDFLQLSNNVTIRNQRRFISRVRWLEFKWTCYCDDAGDEGRPTNYELVRVDLKLFLVLDFGWRTGKVIFAF